ncbi:MAG: GNAT family N-acetyltransferase [Ruminococcus sp.]|nr:GNAT family N-acetyltransferase [Ruminococcus sp.]
MIKIRPTLKSDVDTLCELQKSAFLPIYEKYHDAGNPCLRGAEDILQRLDSSTFKYFTILDNEEIVGGVLYRCEGSTPFVANLKAGEYYLTRIYISPDRQCQGIGKKAILLCENEFFDAIKFYVDFPKELSKNRKCYVNAGFKDSGKELEVEPGLVLVAYEKNITH